MKRPFTNYLKLVMRYLKNDTFKIQADNSDVTDTYTKCYSSNKMKVLIKNTYRYYQKYSTSYEVLYSTGKISFNENNCYITLYTFGKREYNLQINLEIDGKDEFFNYIIEHHTDYLCYEDLLVLKEIKNLTLKIIKGNNND